MTIVDKELYPHEVVIAEYLDGDAWGDQTDWSERTIDCFEVRVEEIISPLNGDFTLSRTTLYTPHEVSDTDRVWTRSMDRTQPPVKILRVSFYEADGDSVYVVNV